MVRMAHIPHGRQMVFYVTMGELKENALRRLQSPSFVLVADRNIPLR